MHNIKKIQMVIKILEKEKDKLKKEIFLINSDMHKKEGLIEKMQNYLNEYMSAEKFGLDKKVPTFSNNMGLFTNQIKTVIVKTENEIAQYKINREEVIVKLQAMEQKVSLIKSYEKRATNNLLLAMNAQEQILLDDIYAVHVTRGKA